MPHRRLLRGKKLLVAAGLAGATFLSCEDTATANLVAPPDSGDDAGGQMDAATVDDAGEFPFDGPVANLLPPPDSGDDSGEATDDAGEPSDAQVIGFPDAPIANLLPPPDAEF